MKSENAVKERPILFSAPMVRAILEGRKTQTRRIVKWALPGYPGYINAGSEEEFFSKLVQQCPMGKPGDRLWVRETWALVRGWDDDSGCIEEWPGKIPKAHPDPEFTAHGDSTMDGRWGPAYREDTGWPESFDERGFNWRPSIFMPRWASRLTLEITNVRVERLQDNSEDDAFDEGVEHPTCSTCHGSGTHPYGDPCNCDAGKDTSCSGRDMFKELWQSINGADSWDTNPWVWVYDFKRI